MRARLFIRPYRVVPLLVCIMSLACEGQRASAPRPAGGVHVLFIGNSLTYVNDLPATVAAIAASAGDTLRVAAAVGPNLGLIDHLNGATDAVSQLRAGGWQFVVLQQGPTTAGLCRDSLVLWTRLFEPLAHQAGATLALLMPWPGATHQDLFDEVRISFEAASVAVGGTFLPAGEAWREAWRTDASLALYGDDGFHPSPVGTYLTALVVYERLTGHDARDLPAQAFSNGRAFPLPTTLVRALQRAAHEANVHFPPASAPSADELARPTLYHPATSGC